jgi:soluble lytic murein transglycosylase-like protein
MLIGIGVRKLLIHKDMTSRTGAPRGRRVGAAGCVASALLLLTAAPATAQIYSWRDANGNLVLSGTRPDREVRTYAVPAAESVRVTRPVVMIVNGRNEYYDDLIAENARRHGIRTDLVRAVVHVESGFNPYAKSRKGALGLMQLMPATIREYRVANPFNPVENIRAGVAYLRRLLDRYNNNEALALAAYNAGPSAVDRHGQNVPPFRETLNYVRRIDAIAGRPLQPRSNRIYRTTEIIDGREIVRYTDQRPPAGAYDIVTR